MYAFSYTVGVGTVNATLLQEEGIMTSATVSRSLSNIKAAADRIKD